MAKLLKFDLARNKETKRWELTGQGSDKAVKSFRTKEAATKAGALENALGEEGGSVRIKKLNGRIQEERTYPGSKDPKKSPG